MHTAPSHGADDFYTGQRYGLDPTCRVDAAGVLHVDMDAWHHPEPPAFEGKKVWAANPLIIELLKQSRRAAGVREISALLPALLALPPAGDLPRHRAVVHRAGDAGEARRRAETTTFRQLAIEEIDKVLWDPAWGKERITNMIATRPDWCISRQRIWGVPIAVFMCEDATSRSMDAALNRKIVDLFEREGAEAWHTTEVDGAAARRDRVRTLRRQGVPQGDRHSRCVVRLRHQLVRGVPSPTPICRMPYARFQKDEACRCCTSRAATSIAAGSTRRC